MGSPTGDEDLGAGLRAELEHRAAETRERENTVSFEEFRDRRNHE